MGCQKNMTLDELRAEAAKLGYKLVKAQKQEYVKIGPCPVCGKKRTSTWISYGNFPLVHHRRCSNCGFQGYPRRTPTEARLGWNEAVKTYLENKKEESDDGACKKMRPL